MSPIGTVNPDVMHGEPCFAGTRVAVRTFFDHLEAGYTVAGFLEQFPTVRRKQVAGLLAALRADAANTPEAIRPAVPALLAAPAGLPPCGFAKVSAPRRPAGHRPAGFVS